MNVAVSITPDGAVGGGWGKARRVAIACVEDGEVHDWVEHDVRWDLAHDEGTEGSHHARIARFLREHEVTAVATGGLGPGMERMLGTMGITVLRAGGDARQAAVATAAG